MATTHPKHSGSSTSPTPLWAVLSLTFFGSLGTGAVTNGLSFIATEGLSYSQLDNLILALALGISYIVGALMSGSIVRVLAQRAPWCSTRILLMITLFLITLACQFPLISKQFFPDQLELSLWVFMLIFSPATGMFWPIIEGYLSGGRSGKTLRQAIGRFNMIWSSALVVSFWLMAPLLEHHPFIILSVLGFCHLLMCIFLFWIPSHPPIHATELHEAPPPIYKPLLTMFRLLLIASYIVLSALSPLLPIVEERLGIDVEWKTPIASAWLISRVVIFVLFERWHGWHGRWWTPWTGMMLMLFGFGACMLSPSIPSGGVILLITGLSIVGAGIATTYCGALYYAMAVGNAEVDAGGKHEAIIGVGYTIGPICGLVGYQATQGEPEPFRFWVISLVSVAVIVCASIGIWLTKRPK